MFYSLIYRVSKKSFSDFRVINVCNQGKTLCSRCMSNVQKTWIILKGYRGYKSSMKVSERGRQMVLCKGAIFE